MQEGKITPTESRFLKLYLRGKTATDAYLTIRPNVTREAAWVSGCRMLKRIKKKSIGGQSLKKQTWEKTGSRKRSAAYCALKKLFTTKVTRSGHFMTMQQTPGALNSSLNCWARRRVILQTLTLITICLLSPSRLQALSNRYQRMSETQQIEIVPAFLPLYEHADDPGIRYFFFWGGRGGAKSYGVGDFHVIKGRSEKARYLMTREIQNSIKDSVHALLKGRINDLEFYDYTITDINIRHKLSGTEFIFAGLSSVTEDQIKSYFNIKRCWVEEAHSITNKSLGVLTPTIRATGSQICFTYNRKESLDPVHDLFLKHKTKKERMRYTDPDGNKSYWNLSRGDGVIRVEINYDGNPLFPEVLERERFFDKENMDTAEYLHKWEGQPEPQPVDAIIPVDDCLSAMKRQVSDQGCFEIGADVARGGKDRVVLYKRKGLKVFPAVVYQNLAKNDKMRTWETAERIIRLAENDKQVRIKVDDTGLGGGVTDELERHGYNVIPVNFQQSASDDNHYVNAISEMWFTFSKIINDVGLPHDTELFEELTKRAEGKRDNKGRRRVESKDDFIARYGRSPDKADALLLAFYEPSKGSYGAAAGINVF